MRWEINRRPDSSFNAIMSCQSKIRFQDVYGFGFNGSSVCTYLIHHCCTLSPLEHECCTNIILSAYKTKAQFNVNSDQTRN